MIFSKNTALLMFEIVHEIIYTVYISVRPRKFTLTYTQTLRVCICVHTNHSRPNPKCHGNRTFGRLDNVTQIDQTFLAVRSDI